MPQSSVKRLLAPMVASCLAACGESAGSSAMRDGDGRSNQLAVSGPIDLGTLGEVVGVSSTAAKFLGHAFLWQREAGMIGLGTLGGSPFSSAIAINALGQVLGGSSRAFLWQNATGMIDLGTLGGFVSSPFAM